MASQEETDREARAAGIMRPPDRTFGRNVTSSKRRLRLAPVGPPPPPLRQSPATVMMLTPGHVASEDSERVMSREIRTSFRHVEEEGEEKEEGRSEDEEEAYFRVVRNPASQLPLTQRVARDSFGRYVSTRDTSSSTERSRPPKRDISWILIGPVLGGPSNWSVLRSFGMKIDI